MKRFLLSTLLVLGFSWQSQAAELTPGNIIGRYKVSGRVGFQKFYINFRVINNSEFEIQRVYANGKGDEVCNGIFNLSSNVAWDDTLLVGSKIFRGVFTCPSNRQRKIDFNIDFKNKTTDDLIVGTTVNVTSSLARGYVIRAFVKKQ